MKGVGLARLKGFNVFVRLIEVVGKLSVPAMETLFSKTWFGQTYLSTMFDFGPSIRILIILDSARWRKSGTMELSARLVGTSTLGASEPSTQLRNTIRNEAAANGFLSTVLGRLMYDNASD